MALSQVNMGIFKFKKSSFMVSYLLGMAGISDDLKRIMGFADELEEVGVSLHYVFQKKHFGPSRIIYNLVQ